MKLRFVLSLATFCLAFTCFAQEGTLVWTGISASNDAGEEWPIRPNRFYQATFPFETFYQKIKTFKGTLNSIILPNANGELAEYHLVRQDVFDKNLQLKYPGYYSYHGWLADQPLVSLSLNMSPYGMHAMMIHENGERQFIEPISGTSNQFMIYKKSDLVNQQTKKWFCKHEEFDTHSFDEFKDLKIKKQEDERAGDCRLRTYRLALACTGEYATFHGGTVEKVLAAYNTAVTRINGVYRKEIGIFFRLVDNIDKIIFLNPSTDPYNNNNTNSMLSQNQTTVDQMIGRENYDIGHVFGTGNGGIASLGSVCSANRKAQGVTGRPNPVGDPFFIDYVAHEMGHQFRANHTQNSDCERNLPTAVEPGSGSTIMGYAGICDPNVQLNSDAYFHTISLSEISSFILSQPTCGIVEILGNIRPSLSTEKNSYTIPVSTPFYLKAIGSDANNDELTFAWEQMNNQTTIMPPRANNIVGPMFRSIPPSFSPIRYFPDLKNKYGQWEVLPSVPRTMNFRCTVRDNSNSGGCTSELNVSVNTAATSGPFLVTKPNSPEESWNVGTTETITWNVANTNIEPVSCAAVDIYLSINGGTSYPILLAKSVPNTGSAEILVPNTPTLIARVMVVAADNIFFDISNFSFKIKSSIQVSLESKKKELCLNQASFPIHINSLQNNQNHNINFELVSSPPDVSVVFPSNITSLPVQDSILVNLLNLPAEGEYLIVFKIVDAPYQIFDSIYLIIRDDIINPLQLSLPANGTQISQSLPVLLQWESDLINNYILQISTSPSFADSITQSFEVVENSFSFDGFNGMYFWRVKGISACTSYPWSLVYMFNKSQKTKYIKPLLRNNGIVVSRLNKKQILASHLSISYEEANPFTYLVVQQPLEGLLQKWDGIQNVPLQSGDFFTDDDIRQGKISYQHMGGTALSDKFDFLIENANFWSTPAIFPIKILPDTGQVAFLEIEKDIACHEDQAKIILTTREMALPLEFVVLPDSVFNPLPGDTLVLPSGSYQFIVRDANLHELVTNKIEITAPPLLRNDSELKFYNIHINSSGGAGFSRGYSLDGILFGNDSIYLDVPNGTYITSVRDVNHCVSLDTVEVNIQGLTIDSLLFDRNLACYSHTTAFQPYISGGFSPYKFMLNTVPQSDFPKPLGPGNYILSVIDAGGKEIDTNFQVFSPEPIVSNLHIDRRDVTWASTGGVPPYQYSFDGVLYFYEDFALDLANGEYSLTIRDSNACTAVESFKISILESILIEVSNPLCYGENGYIRVTPENGTAPVLFGINKNQLDTIALIENLPSGDYNLYITDAVGDSIEQKFSISQPDSLDVQFVVMSDTLIIQVKGGTPPYRYSVDSGFTYFTFNEFYHVPKGRYQILVKDANDCLQDAFVEITYSSTIDQNLFSLFKVYPIPTKDVVFFEKIIKEVKHISFTLSDITGRILPEVITCSNVQCILSLEHLPTGIYFLHIHSEKGQGQFKIMKL